MKTFVLKILINQISILEISAGKHPMRCEILWAKIPLLKAYFPDVLQQLLPYFERKAYTVLIIDHAIISMSDGALHLKYIPGSDNVHPVLCCIIICKNKTRERACNACADGLTQLPVIS